MAGVGNDFRWIEDLRVELPENVDDEEALILSLLPFVKEAGVPGWEDVSPFEVSATTLTGGITNRLFLLHRSVEGVPAGVSSYLDSQTTNSTTADDISIPDASSSAVNAATAAVDVSPYAAVCVRQFGVGTEAFIDRTAETEIFHSLAKAGTAPIFWAACPNGRVEGFVIGRNPSLEQLASPAVYSTVAAAMRTFHQQVVGDKPSCSGYWLWSNLERYVSLAKGSISQLQSRGMNTCLAGLSLEEIIEEGVWLRNEIEKLSNVSYSPSTDGTSQVEYMYGQKFGLETVLCHNDMLSGNLLIRFSPEGVPELTLVDFEYSAYNFRSFDMGNHFCEWGGDSFNMDLFPNRATRDDFYQAYLNGLTLPGDIITSTDFRRGLDEAVCLLALASHLLWSVWVYPQAVSSTIDYDFMAYGNRRFAAYLELKSRREKQTI